MNKTVNFQINSEYKSWIRNLKKRFRQVQIKAAVKVNSTLLEFYWQLGSDIVEKQKNISWGSGFLKQLSADLKKEFPDIKGFSVNNLQYIIRWFSFYSNGLENMEQPVPHLKSEIKKEKLANAIEIPFPQLFQIPWGHNLVIISKSNTIDEAFFYVENSIKHGWSRAVLTHQIESGFAFVGK
jgi:predicted nuclease of restriction endonuclease-like (RecB) superfamily